MSLAEDCDHVLAGDDEITDCGLHGEQVIVPAGPPDQAADIDGLDGSVPAGRHYEYWLTGGDLDGRFADLRGPGDSVAMVRMATWPARAVQPS